MKPIVIRMFRGDWYEFNTYGSRDEYVEELGREPTEYEWAWYWFQRGASCQNFYASTVQPQQLWVPMYDRATPKKLTKEEYENLEG